MSTRRSDAASAALAAVAVVALARRRGRSLRELVRPGPFCLGVAAAVGVEAVFARWPARAARVWRRPAVRIGSPVALVAAAAVAGRRAGGAAFAAVLGGLAGYFGLLAGIVAGVVPEPATWFDPTAERPDSAAGRPDPSDGPVRR